MARSGTVADGYGFEGWHRAFLIDAARSHGPETVAEVAAGGVGTLGVLERMWAFSMAVKTVAKLAYHDWKAR